MNVGSETAKMLVFFTPGGAEEFWLEVGEEATEDNIGVWWTEEQFEAVEETLERHHVRLLPGDEEAFKK
ncbi:hypothetical protein SAMN05421507_108149 [Lentzea jiangxiensis]|uniref:Uncharacterized protein n=1 Tax=Lentzea jiangxiensis TaxID=641025 RepID=A0A1H0SM45_9PSEU|nr:hypothetical protein SAMN05421507_108149 [Lentzea jiangxiensis]